MNRRGFFKIITGFVAGVTAAFVPSKTESSTAPPVTCGVMTNSSEPDCVTVTFYGAGEDDESPLCRWGVVRLDGSICWDCTEYNLSRPKRHQQALSEHDLTRAIKEWTKSK